MNDSIDPSPSSNKVSFLDQTMNSEYHLGEIVLAQNATYSNETNGTYAEIAQELHWGYPLDLHSMEHGILLGYCIEVFGPTGIHLFATPNQLRKIKGDEGQLRRQTVKSEKPELVEL